LITPRVLVADNDPALRASYREAPLRDGFAVVTAGDGLDCVARMRSFRPDLLVLDPGLPWGGGEGVLALMAEGRDVPRARVMVLSDHWDGQLLGPVAEMVPSAYYLRPLAPGCWPGAWPGCSAIKAPAARSRPGHRWTRPGAPAGR
jgi:DNA-binding response OmpR family regulator